VPGSDAAVLAISLGIRQPAFASRTPDQIELLLRSFTTTGDPKVGDDQVIPITIPAAPPSADVSRYEVLARLDVLKPGPYHVRLSAHSVASDTRGSVYVDVDVPDFRKDKVSLSGIVLNSALGAVPVAPLRLLRDTVPLTPTTERTFATADVVTAFLRVYQGAAEKLAAVPLKITIQDGAGKSVFDKTETLPADRFATDNAADYQFRLPLATLKTGEYLLTFETAAGKTTVRRDVRVTIK
jgi:hypothetical protein